MHKARAHTSSFGSSFSLTLSLSFCFIFCPSYVPSITCDSSHHPLIEVSNRLNESSVHQISFEQSVCFCLEGKTQVGAYCGPVTLKRFVDKWLLNWKPHFSQNDWCKMSFLWVKAAETLKHLKKKKKFQSLFFTMNTWNRKWILWCILNNTICCSSPYSGLLYWRAYWYFCFL